MFLKKIIRDPNNPKQFSFDTVPPIYVVYASVANRGDRNNEPKPDEYMKLPGYEVKIDRNDEKWNVYRILRSGQIIRMRLIVNRIQRVKDRFDKDGMPFYIINSGPMVVLDPSRADYEKQ